ncbi:hypothetical protein C3747_84g95 [Trypanosoma cruzi]|uniref:Uncharacterized protein n=2 Tax=Trypanosoma cruzi TaxID=5693 RepID=Q4DAH0_TRYCC|nr:uncharacterized protein Tc00.1047053507559.30 [Trypanosoma cruzi]EAN89515.1 hypothetical protein, conserved [Trypanosoma cruzi]PWV08956.1 hypothetical protein C3747_84g95 [Trypanosoma cruzi]RNC53454.1 hypothetical protein TcCL_ESM09219 [Trypanosoma cruzi]|eukprot:XP_811366.1 hypothetical protein [Trypanosoma cruzi strain CL Brener]
MRLSAVARCAPSSGTLSSRLTHLVQSAEEHIASRGTAATVRDDGLWEQVLATAHCARALKETDTTLAIVFRLLRCGCYPSRSAVWPGLIRDLAPYSDIEANAVLSYPGVPEGPESQSEAGPWRCARVPEDILAAGRESEVPDMPPLLRPTRETLLMTGGVVPLSARIPCSDGGALSVLLESFCSVCEASHGGDGDGEMTVNFFQDVTAAVVSAMQPITATIVLTESSPLARALVRFFRLLFNFSARQSGGQLHLAENFAKGLTKLLPENALGARMVLLFLAEHHAEYGDEMVHIPLVRIAAGAIWRQYEKHESFSCLRQIQHVNDAVDVTLQRNANNGNPLALDDSDEAALRLLLSLALLRVMRVEAVSPDVFLRDAVDIVDRSPMTLSIEYELIVAKVELLDLFLDDESSSSAIYDDLLHSLRAIVELRPRDGVDGDTSAVPDATHYSIKEDEEEVRELARQQFQEAHRLVLTVFARSQLDERLNQAYTVLVTHKYHGLVITRDVANPLLDALSRRGDCRVFNIVDLCVLYSGSHIDYDTLTYLFRACRVAGDFYRARTLYQLLREMIPGFLLRAPEAIKDALQELKILQPEPAHLFPASLAVDGDEAAAAVNYEGVVDDEALTARQRGPIRELPTKRTHTPS